MSILLSLTPFILFALLTRVASIEMSLFAAAALSAGLILRDRLRHGGAVKVLEAGTVTLFAGLALYTLLARASWTVVGVRLAVDAGLFLIALVSMMIRQPFTLQFAREQVPRELWDHPRFRATNYAITGAWTAAFAVQVLADLVILHVPAVPIWLGVSAIVGSLAAAIWFTGWYPARQQRLGHAEAEAARARAQ